MPRNVAFSTNVLHSLATLLDQNGGSSQIFILPSSGAILGTSGFVMAILLANLALVAPFFSAHDLSASGVATFRMLRKEHSVISRILVRNLRVCGYLILEWE